MKTQMIKFLEENIGVNFCDFSIGNSLLGMALKSHKQNKIYMTWAYLKLKTFVLQI